MYKLHFPPNNKISNERQINDLGVNSLALLILGLIILFYCMSIQHKDYKGFCPLLCRRNLGFTLV